MENRRSKIYLIGVPEGENGENRGEAVIKERMVEDFSELMKNTNTEIQEEQRVMSTKDKNKFRSEFTAVKLQNGKDQEKFLQNITILLSKCVSN